MITTLIDNAASATVKGAELEMVAQITEAFGADLGIGYIDGKYGRLSARNGAVPGNPLTDMTGNDLPRAPEWTVNAGVSYTMQLANIGELQSRAEWSHTAKQYFTPFNEDISMQSSYSVVNLIMSLEMDDSPLSFRGYVRNLFDKDYRSGGFTSGIMFFARGNWAPPRTVGVELTAKF